MERSALISPDGLYRYWLRRKWRDGPGYLLWIMLNPSTADALEDDTTIRKCVGFATKWGYSDLYVVNMFAFRTTYPTELKQAADPVGPDNDKWILQLAVGATGIVAGWGDSGPPKLVRERLPRIAYAVREAEVFCIGHTKSGAPRHPSRLGYSTPIELHWGVMQREGSLSQ
jgi:hypothetical protein